MQTRTSTLSPLHLLLLASGIALFASLPTNTHAATVVYESGGPPPGVQVAWWHGPRYVYRPYYPAGRVYYPAAYTPYYGPNWYFGPWQYGISCNRYCWRTGYHGQFRHCTRRCW